MAGILLNHITADCKDTPNDILEYDINIYNKLTNENLTIERVKEYVKY